MAEKFTAEEFDRFADECSPLAIDYAAAKIAAAVMRPVGMNYSSSHFKRVYYAVEGLSKPLTDEGFVRSVTVPNADVPIVIDALRIASNLQELRQLLREEREAHG